MTQTRHLSVPARFDQLSRLTAFAVDAARNVGFDKPQLDHIELAVDEACSNIIEHAYAGVIGEIDIKVEVEIKTNAHGYIKIVLTDTGNAFEPDNVPAYVPCTHETDISNLKVGGLGIHLMRQTMDDVCFEFNVRDAHANANASNGKTGVFNRLTLIKRL